MFHYESNWIYTNRVPISITLHTTIPPYHHTTIQGYHHTGISWISYLRHETAYVALPRVPHTAARGEVGEGDVDVDGSMHAGEQAKQHTFLVARVRRREL